MKKTELLFLFTFMTVLSVYIFFFLRLLEYQPSVLREGLFLPPIIGMLYCGNIVLLYLLLNFLYDTLFYSKKSFVRLVVEVIILSSISILAFSVSNSSWFKIAFFDVTILITLVGITQLIKYLLVNRYCTISKVKENHTVFIILILSPIIISMLNEIS